MSLPFLILLLLLSKIGAYDFCNTDPRVVVLDQTPSPSTNSSQCHTVIYIPELISNPNHVIHDNLWAVSHYLLHCVSTPVVLVVQKMDLKNAAKCNTTVISQNERGPRWGACLVLSLALRHGAIIHSSQEKSWPIKQVTHPELCLARHVWIGVKPKNYKTNGVSITLMAFRSVSWMGRYCELGPPCDTGLVPLPTEFKKSAFLTISESVFEFIGISHRRKLQDKINVCMYDRNDTKKRQWMGADDIYQRLKVDSRLHVKFFKKMPTSFVKQVELFAWADVILAPHGAGMTNTIFMRNGSDVIEIRKRCASDANADRFMPWDWTGWHSAFFGLNLIYAQCHKAGVEIKSGKLQRYQSSEDENAPVTVDTEEVMGYVNICIRRQLQRRELLAAKMNSSLEVSHIMLRKRGTDIATRFRWVFYGLGLSSVLFCALTALTPVVMRQLSNRISH